MQQNAIENIKYQKICHKMADLLFNKFRFIGSRKLARFLNKLILPPLTETTTSSTIFDFKLNLNPENGKEIYYLGFYEMGTLNIIQKCLRPGDTFIDAGASIGLMSFYASKIVGNKGKVLSFEPIKSSFKNLSDSILLNNSTNIHAFNKGLGNTTTQIPIYLNRPCPSMVKEKDSDDDHFEIVTIDRLDKILEENKINTVRMIKIDVEGFELDVLKGANKLLSTPNAPIICFEYIKSLSNAHNATESPITYLKQINPLYKFYQLSKTYNTISKLKLISAQNEFRDNDNIFAILDTHLVEIQNEILH